MGQRSSALTAMACVFCLLFWAGCGGSGRPETARVSGRVTYNGQPVAGGRIVFQPDQGRPALGAIGPDGYYTLTTFDRDDGAVLGRHRVTIKATRQTGAPPPKSVENEIHGSGLAGGMEWLVPKQYASLDSTPLAAEVKRGKNTIDFNLP